MDHDTLVIVPDAPSVVPLLDLLHLLHHQRLLRPFYVWIAGDERCRSIADEPRSKTAERYDLLDFVRGAVDDFCVAHLHLADAPSTADSHDLATRAERTIRSSLSFGDERFRQRLHLFNLVAPVAEPGRLPHGSALAGEVGLWSNLIVMPEVQERSDLAVVPVRPDEQYVAHVACNLASIIGLWVGSSLDDTSRRMPTASKTASLDHWQLVRTRERLISAPELPDIVVGGVTRTILTAARRGELRLEMVADRDVDRLVRALIELFVTEHRLVAVDPVASGEPSQRIVGFRAFLRVLGQFLRTVPKRIVGEISALIRGFRRRVLQRLDRVVGTEDLEFRFADLDDEAKASTGRTSLDQPIRTATIDAQPELWAGLRRLAFGLLDGSEPDELYRDLLQRGKQRLILPDPRWCVDPSPPTAGTGPQSGPVDGPTDASPDPGGQQSGLDVANGGQRAFVDRLVMRIEAEHARAVAMTRQLREHHQARRKELESTGVKPASWRARVGRLIRVTWRILRPLLWIAALVAVVVYLPVLLPVAGLLAVGIIGAAYLLVVLVLVRKFVRFLAQWFRDENLRGIGVPELVALERRIDAAEDQQETLRQQLAVAREWREVIRSVVYEPFGPPIPSEHNRIRDIDLSLPDSHKVEEGTASRFRESGIVEVIRERVFSAGWLQTQYAGAIDYVAREQQIAQPGVPFLPDSDTSLPGARQSGDRRRLLEALSTGRAMRDSRMRLVHQVHHHLRSGDDLPLAGVHLVDWLFTDTSGGSKATGFLSEADAGRPSAWNREQLFVRLGTIGASDTVRRVASGEVVVSPLPDLPDAEAVLEGDTVTYDPLLFRSQCVEMSINVPEAELLAFADGATAVDIDLSRATDLWVIPPPLDEGDVEVFTDEERDRWGIDESVLPPLLDLIVPSGPVLPPSGNGPYKFMEEAFGRPVPIRRRRIPYVVRTAAAPPNGTEIVRRVLQHTSDTTGLEFEFAGNREDIPRRGETIDYLYIAWAFDAEYREYEVHCGHSPGASIGLGGPIVRGAGDGTLELIGGTAVLNAEMSPTHELDMWPNHALVLLHEIGHALNLGHVSSKHEVMAQAIWTPGLSAWGHGDRRGLQLVVAEAMRLGDTAA